MHMIWIMRFEWDEDKDRGNIRIHKISFKTASKAFDGPMLIEPEEKKEYGERRFMGIGIVENRFVLIIFSEPEPEIIRLISARKALKHERKKFEKALQR